MSISEGNATSKPIGICCSFSSSSLHKFSLRNFTPGCSRQALVTIFFFLLKVQFVFLRVKICLLFAETYVEEEVDQTSAVSKNNVVCFITYVDSK
ncbi:hypothetical protein HanIR_Chr12g0613021 [Helianthus annuus]|nr:hypothetical protein HanIR_Chr12g0613021 [Helianthus annuus]